MTPSKAVLSAAGAIPLPFHHLHRDLPWNMPPQVPGVQGRAKRGQCAEPAVSWEGCCGWSAPGCDEPAAVVPAHGLAHRHCNGKVVSVPACLHLSVPILYVFSSTSVSSSTGAYGLVRVAVHRPVLNAPAFLRFSAPLLPQTQCQLELPAEFLVFFPLEPCSSFASPSSASDLVTMCCSPEIML